MVSRIYITHMKTMLTRKEVLELAKKKQDLARKIIETDNAVSNSILDKMLIDKLGSKIAEYYYTNIRRELGITMKYGRKKNKHPKKKRLSNKFDKNKIAELKRDYVALLISQNPNRSQKDMMDLVKKKFGKGISNKYVSNIQQDFGLSTKFGKKRKKPQKITRDDVIVLQDQSGMPNEMQHILHEMVTYMRDIGISYLELKDTGEAKVRMQREIETVV